MSEPRRLPIVAIGAAVLALIFALVAVIVVIRREEPAAVAKSATPAPVAPLVDRTVKASDVLLLKSERPEVVVEAGITKGVRLTNPDLAKVLGLEDGDVITSIAGRRLDREYATSDMMFKLTMLDPTVVYVDIERKGQPTVIRWKLDGNLREERNKVAGIGTSTFGSASVLGSSSVPSLPDALLATIVKVDDTTYKLPRATADKILADPVAAGQAARVVPAIKNGQPDGFKIYAVRPSSIYARLGIMNGDTIQTVNGTPLTTPDKALEAYTKLKGASAVTIELMRRGKPVTLTIQVTK